MLETIGIILDVIQIVLTGALVVLLYKRTKEEDSEE